MWVKLSLEWTDTLKQSRLDFVRVVTQSLDARVSVVLPNGVRLEFHGEFGVEQLIALVTAVSALG